MRVTKVMIENVARVIVNLLKSEGMVAQDARYVLTEGSSTYGNSWGLHLLGEHGGREYMPGVDLTGCWTKREAYDRLNAANDMLWAVALHRSEK